MDSALPAVALFTPLIGAVLIALTGKKPNVREGVTLVTAVILFGMVASMWSTVSGGEQLKTHLVDIMSSKLSLSLAVEPLGLIYALVASFLWIFNSVYSIGYMRTLYGAHSEGQTRYYTCFAVAIFSALGIAFSGNLLTLFLFYEVLTFSTYPLVTHARNDAAFRSGRIYLGILVGTSTMFLLAATVWTYVLAGTLDFTEGGVLAGQASAGTVIALTCLFFFGTGKTALMPFHMWLPNAMVAPTPVSALLHAVAVVKAGVFTVLKISIAILGLETMRESGAGNLVAWFAAVTIIVASLFAMAKDNLKARLAYSTIGQLSYIVLAAALATQASVTGGAMHIAMHAFGKITLFFCAGAIYATAHKTKVSELAGIGKKMPITMLCFLVGAISTIGLPPFGGAWSKWYLAQGTMEAGDIAFLVVLLVSSLLNIAYLLPIPLIAFFGKEKSTDDAHASEAAHAHDGHGHADHGEAPLLCRIPIIVTATGCLVLFVYPNLLHDLAAMAASK